MACIQRVPNCALGSSPDPVVDPLKKFGSIIAVIGSIAGVFGIAGVLQTIATILGGAMGLGAAGGAIAVIGVLVLIGLYAANRCTEGKGLPQCIAGCVSNIQESFSQASEIAFPFTAQHNRVDVTVKSFFWDFVELNNAFVYCTGDPYPMMSEIMHCYYYTKRVCDAEAGAIAGAVVGGVAGIIIGAAIAAAIGCATVILCFLALIIAAIVAVVAALVGAFAGGNIVQAAEGDTAPTDSGGNTITVGQLVTVNGNMEQLGEDNNSNCFWWVHSTQIHGVIAAGTHEPYSYCDIDEQLVTDACPRVKKPDGSDSGQVK